MANKFTLVLFPILIFALTACDHTHPPSETHTDTSTANIDSSNALSIASKAYRVIAVDAPFTASESMDDSGNINNAACVDPNTISGSAGDMSGMSQMGMLMVFQNCQLKNTNASGHSIVVNGECNNTAESASVETVTGDKISFSTLPDTGAEHTLSFHGFSVTRDNDNMIKASGSLHMANGDIVAIKTTTDFTGTAQNPTAGSMTITGANGTSLRLSISTTTSDAFDLMVDINGDGDYQDTNETLFTSENWTSTFWPQVP